MTEEFPLVSVILPVYKEPPAFYEEAYSSIMRQTYKNLEILILLDNPEHNDAIKYFKKKSLDDPNTHLIINESNLGLIKTLNKSISHVSGKYIARMDSDDIAIEERIEQQVSFLEANGLDLVGSFAETIDQNGKHLGYWKMPTTTAGINSLTKYHTPALHPTWLLKTEMIKKLGGYREITHVEDHDFIARVILNQYKVGNLPKVLLRYRINLDSVSNQNSQWAYWGRIFIGKRFADHTLNSEIQEDFKLFINNKLILEKEDPRANYHLMIRSLRKFKLFSFLNSVWKLFLALPQVLHRLKSKIIIRFIILLDSFKF